MRRSTRLLAALCAGMVGCATAPAVEIGPAYRSPEGFNGANWGATPSELASRLRSASLLDANTWQQREVVLGRPAWVSYIFSGGHLTSVTAQFDPPAGSPHDFDDLYGIIVREYGESLPPPGSHDHTADTVATIAAVVLVLVTVGVILAIVGKGGGHAAGHIASGGAHAASAIHASIPPLHVIRPGVARACWINLAALRLTADAAHVAVDVAATTPGQVPQPAPQGGWMAAWKTAETRVVLFGVNLGAPDARLAVSYSSTRLAPRPETSG